MITRNEIEANRIAWAKFLMEPGRKKMIGFMEGPDGESRCCLGHAAHLFNIKKISKYNDVEKCVVTYFDGTPYYAPESLVELLGLWDHTGRTRNIMEYLQNGMQGETPSETIGPFNDLYYGSLSEANDKEEEITPYQIGEYILTAVKGGVATPFKPLEDYP